MRCQSTVITVYHPPCWAMSSLPKLNSIDEVAIEFTILKLLGDFNLPPSDTEPGEVHGLHGNHGPAPNHWWPYASWRPHTRSGFVLGELRYDLEDINIILLLWQITLWLSVASLMPLLPAGIQDLFDWSPQVIDGSRLGFFLRIWWEIQMRPCHCLE